MNVRHRTAGERGASLVELALISPLLIMIVGGGVDYARIFYQANVLTDAARACAQYAGQTPDTDKDADAQQLARNIVLDNLRTAVDEVDFKRTYPCFDDNGTFSNENSLVPTACTGLNKGIIITVTVRKQFSTIMAVVPGVSGTVDVRRSARLRVQ